MRTTYGGFEEAGVTKDDCKNFKRDINLFIGKYDAEMIVRHLTRKKEFLPDFLCEYFTSEDNSLAGLFWADEEMKRNYINFGDVISFDSTFRSNKYDMLFVPFTAIDNHHRNVTVGAALLASETADSYKWLLGAFKKCMGKEPRVVVTDQDHVMRKDIEEVFPTSGHRLCMWHIMKKVADKIRSLSNNMLVNHCVQTENLKQHICEIVWNDYIEIDDFESRWKDVMNEFNLAANKWMADMYSIRSDWIPAYYRHEHMSGLMRTTSRSESENHFFGKCINSRITLVEFLSNFETAIEAQRFTHRKNDHDTRYKNPDWVTDYELEKEANEIYTRNIFYDVQEEIFQTVNKCMSVHTTEVGDFTKFKIKELDHDRSGLYEVLYRDVDMIVTCSCNRFEQYGLLCRHVFYVLRVWEVKVFPKNYVIRRWTRDAVPTMYTKNHTINGSNQDDSNDVEGIVREIMLSNDYIVNQLVDNMDNLVLY